MDEQLPFTFGFSELREATIQTTLNVRICAGLEKRM